jgi:hypothetical protein
MDILGTAKGLLTALAPTIATAIGGPFAGVATQKLIGALGLSTNTTQDELMSQIVTATPEQLLKLKEADQAFAVEMRKLDIDVMKLEVSDTDSARKREIATQDYTPRIIAALILGLYMFVQWFILGHVVESSMREIVLRSLGTLDAAVGLILGYYFGSSVGSRTKDTTIQLQQTK